jgi:N-methylhydantoinase A
VRYMLAADTGGTFTDAALSLDRADPVIGKSLTTHDRVFRGIEGAVDNAAQALGTTSAEVFGAADVFVYGTTHATNAIVTGNTARTALLCTEGFADVLVLREGGKRSPFDFATDYPAAYVPRSLTYEVGERVTSDGGVLTPLDEDRVRASLEQARADGVEAIAVCLLWSIANPAHERRIGELIEEQLPGVPYTLSHQLNPVLREYRRASSAAIDASLKPLMQQHLRQLRDDLDGAGFGGSLLVVTSMGGVMHVEDLIQRPIYSVRSGPAMAPVGAQVYAGAERPGRDLIVCDTGGTTFDVSLTHGGRIKETRETWLGGRFVGHITGMSSVDVESIGSGGGSIAWVDPGGLLRVGPQSAGSEPGPACYGRGGQDATVTDAALVLGLLDADHFLGGRMPLDRAAAEAAVDRVAEQVGLSRERTAHGIYVLASDHMVQAISELTVQEGVDPRESLIVAGGGAAGLNIALIAQELSVDELLVPRTAGVLSACGGLFSDVVEETSLTQFATTREFPFDTVGDVLDRLDGALDDVERRLQERGVRDGRRTYSTEARYPSQTWELEVPLPAERIRTADDVARLEDAFHATHERVFAVQEPGQSIECLYWRARLTAKLDGPTVEPRDVPAAEAPEPRVVGRSYFGDRFWDTPRYHGTELVPGVMLDGPLIVDEATTTVVVPPDCTITTTPYGYMVALGATASIAEDRS